MSEHSWRPRAAVAECEKRKCCSKLKMARYDKSERGLLAEICQKYPIIGDKGYGGDILKKKKVAWQKIASEFNSSTPGRVPRTEEQIRGLWKRLKISTKEKIDAMRSEARKTGGGPSSNLNLDPVEEIVSGMLGSSVDPLPMDHDNDAVAFQEGQILVEMGEGVVVEEAVPEMVVEDVPPENERRSAPLPQKKADIALIGLAVMGQNLILNMNDHGFVVCAYNRTTEKVDQFLANEAKGTKVIGAHSLEDMVAKLKKPRRVMMLVKAGQAVDDFIDKLVPLLEKGDIIIDGGNSEYQDSQRRCKQLKEKGLLFVGSGVSGGEDGARYGPSLMPGGNPEAWPSIKSIFQSISAKANGEPCCDWVGEDGAGHFVKMVHNGIEYGDMQLICEAYHLMKSALNLTHQEMSQVFEEWNKGELDSFLIEITKDIMKFKDSDGSYLLEKIRDSAGQKGTGKWTAISALEYGIPVTLIGEAVFARCLSSLKDERRQASSVLKGPNNTTYKGDKKEFLEHIRQALYASKIISYAQGFMLLREAAKVHGWNLNYGAIALMWRGGCIIRSVFLGNIKTAFERKPDLPNLLLDSFFANAVQRCQNSWRTVVASAAQLGIPTPTFSTALSFYDGYRSEWLPANLLQAQRDYFGAHTYELLNNPGVFKHTNWTGHGGNVSASTYQA